MSDVGDAPRSQKGAVAYLRDMGNGTSRLVFDDVTSESLPDPIGWSFECLYTRRDYSDADLAKMKLSDREFKTIGENLVARLLALKGHVK